MSNSNNKTQTTSFEQRKLLFETWQKTHSVTRACQQVGVSRGTFYHWKKRFDQGGFKALAHFETTAPQKPHRTPARVVEQVTYLKEKYPKWGKSQIARFVNECKIYPDSVSPNTVKRILVEAGLWTER
ncbi:MAG: helix-turn-helix domain-containing protein [Caldilineaceae bacterium]